jgi:hypothetical protein
MGAPVPTTIPVATTTGDFASKESLDSASARISDLEQLLKALDARESSHFGEIDLRVKEAESLLKENHERRITALEADFTQFKATMAGMNSSDNSSLDSSQIMMRINLLGEDISKKADKTEV